MRSCLLSTATLVVAFSAVSLGAESPGETRRAELAARFGAAQRANGGLLRSYIWQSRTQVQVEGETKKVLLYEVRFDLDGKVQRTEVGGTAPPQKSSRRKRGVRARITKKKQEKGQELARLVTDVAKDYTMASAGTWLDFFQKASYHDGEGDLEGTIRVQASGFVVAGDTVKIWIDSGTDLPRQFEFWTTRDGQVVEGTVEYRAIEDGPNYPARTVIRLPGKRVMEAKVENFDYRETLH